MRTEYRTTWRRVATTAPMTAPDWRGMAHTLALASLLIAAYLMVL